MNDSRGNFQPCTQSISAERDRRWYLQKADIESFGAFGRRSIGPFCDGMNIVYGENEAGKSTLAAFIAGVLFGWPVARGKKNSYRPKGGSRAGRLTFATDDGSSVQVSRRTNAEGLQGATWLVDDIDAEEYRRLFALDADELRSLDKGPSLMSRLLTAGSGTETSPEAVRQKLADEAKACFSRRASQEHSITVLQQKIKDAEEEVARESAKADTLRELHEEHRLLQQRKEQLSKRLKQQNAKAERLSTQVSLVETLEQQRDDRLLRAHSLSRSLCRSSADENGDASDGALNLPVDSTGNEDGAADSTDDGMRVDAQTRATVDRLYEKRIRLEQDLSTARDNLDRAEKRNAELQRDDAFLKAASKEHRARRLQSVVSIVLPIAVLLIGIPLFIFGRSMGSMTVTAFGVAMIAGGALVAVAALFTALRPNQSDDLTAQRREDAQWVVDREKNRLQACEKALQDHRSHSESVLKSLGLGRFQTIEQAREALNARYESRFVATMQHGNQDTIRVKIDDARRSARDIQSRIDGVLADAGADDIVALDGLVHQMLRERDALQQECDRCSNQLGRSEHQLQVARNDDGLAAAQQKLQDLQTRLEESELSYARLLLAQRNLADALNLWQEESQPAVYRRASEILSAMTDGAWVTVRNREKASLEVVADDGRALQPELLSLGTCQQLYLSLRIALLLVADNVGRNVPVLADDILVNFDDKRVASAAKALLQLSQKRQVIVFTSHQKIVDLFRDIYPPVKVVTLSRTQGSL